MRNDLYTPRKLCVGVGVSVWVCGCVGEMNLSMTKK